MFGYRVARTKIDGRPTTVLITDATEASGDVDVVKAIGVMVILGKAQKTGES
jgi:hypothetical protein